MPMMLIRYSYLDKMEREMKTEKVSARGPCVCKWLCCYHHRFSSSRSFVATILVVAFLALGLVGLVASFANGIGVVVAVLVTVLVTCGSLIFVRIFLDCVEIEGDLLHHLDPLDLCFRLWLSLLVGSVLDSVLLVLDRGAGSIGVELWHGVVADAAATKGHDGRAGYGCAMSNG